MAKDLTDLSGKVDQFLAQVDSLKPVVQDGTTRPRLAFVIDATASRQHTWDCASQLQGEMLQAVEHLGGLEIQVLWFRGFSELKKTPWLGDGTRLANMMSGVTCRAGKTQIERSLRQLLRESSEHPVRACVYIGDACEEPSATLFKLAGQLGLKGTAIFMFQEGQDQRAAEVFERISQLSGGVYCRFDQQSADMLRELLGAVAAYAAGGKTAVQQLPAPKHRIATQLLEQLAK